MSRTPTLEEVLRAAVRDGLGTVHTAMPGRVESYDAATQKADVQPLVMNVVLADEGGAFAETLPVLTDVPVVFPRGGGFFLTLPLAPGDHVLLVFCERSIDKFTAGDGGVTDPIDARRHNLSDAVALPGFYPFRQPVADASAADMVLGEDEDGVQLALTADGKVRVTFGGGQTVTIEGKDQTAKITLGDGAVSMTIAETLQALYTQLLLALAVHTHTITAPGSQSSPPTNVAAFPPWDPTINSTKVKVPNG